MKKKEILELFNNEMSTHFEKWGFNFSKTRLTAKKIENGITKIIFFDANYFLGRASFQPYLRVRHEEIMKIRGTLTPRYDNDHFVTIGLHLSEVAEHFNQKELNFLSENLGNHDGGSYVYDKTIQFFKIKFIEFMETIGNKFFESFYTTNDFDKWFNHRLLDGKYETKMYNQDRIPIYSLISAYITNNEFRNEIYGYWIKSSLYQEAKDELVQMKKYLERISNDI